MLPQEIELKILEYLNIKPMKRCRATNSKGKICKKNAKKGYLICYHHHKKIIEKSYSCNRLQFMELCIMLRMLIKNNIYKFRHPVNYDAWWKQSCPLYA